MKYKFILFLFCVVGLSVSAQTSKLYIKETNGNYRVSGIGLTNLNVIVTTNCITSDAVIGTTNQLNAVEGMVVKVGADKRIHQSLIGSTNSFQVYNGTNMVAGAALNIFSYTTTLGSGAVVRANFTAFNAGNNSAAVMQIREGAEQVSAAQLGAANVASSTPQSSTCVYSKILLTNITLNGWISLGANSSVGGVATINSVVTSNLTHFSVTEQK